MKALKLKIHPPIILLISIILTYLAGHYLPSIAIPPAITLFQWPISAIGVMIALAGIWQFRQSSTTINPTKPQKTSRLVSSGIFRVTRNPMYLGMLLIAIATVLKFGNLTGVVGVIFFMLYITFFQIKPEEVIIEKIFGADYVTYKNKVRRWL